MERGRGSALSITVQINRFTIQRRYKEKTPRRNNTPIAKNCGHLVSYPDLSRPSLHSSYSQRVGSGPILDGTIHGPEKKCVPHLSQ